MQRKLRTKESGYTLIEALVYIVVLVFMMTVVVSSLVSVSRVYRQVRIIELVHSNAHEVMETLSREIRTATSVNTGSSTFDSVNGTLALNSVDLSLNNKTVTVTLNNGRVEMSEDSSSLGPLTSSHATVSALYFEHISATSSEAVKYYVTLSVGSGDFERTETFYDTVVLRGSYEI